MTSVELEIAERRAHLARAIHREHLAIAVALGTFLIAGAVLFSGAGEATGLPRLAILGGGAAAVIVALSWRIATTRRRRSASYALQWRERAQRRCADDFAFGQDSGSALVDANHRFALDLDVFGPGSLYERLNDCHTVLGRDSLAELLQNPTLPYPIAERQAAVRELIAAQGWRETLEIELCHLRDLGSRDALERRHLENDTRALLTWQPGPARPTTRRLLLNALSIVATIAAAGYVGLGWPWAALAPFYFVNLAVLALTPDMDALLTRFLRVRATLKAWSRVLSVLENAAPRAHLLADLRAELHAGSAPASRAIARLSQLADRLAQRRNPIWYFTLDVLWLVDRRVRHDLLAWQAEHGAHLGRWLRAAARLEALHSLAAYAECAPGHVWPVVQNDGPMFATRNLAHPLLPARTRVGNDLSLADLGTVLLVTGSNMSGKSTYLRAVGLAVVMTRLGLPVVADHLEMHDAEVITAMRVQDSLRDGSSRFQAEVRRLKQCIDHVRAHPFSVVLLDEILAGTNSRERHLGTRAVLKTLAQLKAVILIATHDLELTALEHELDHCRVVHFRDGFADQQLTFDYRMRPGPLTSTNALKVMKSAGLDVE